MMIRKNRLKIVIAGAGLVTRYHIEAWKKLPRVEIAAICARHLENARKRAAEFKLPAAYDDVAVMLDKEKPDILDIAAPPEVHAELATLAQQYRTPIESNSIEVVLGFFRDCSRKKCH